MKKLLLFLAFVGFLAGLYFYAKAPDSNPLYLSTDNQILPSPIEKPAIESEVMQLIQFINKRNSTIKSFVCDDVTIHYSQRMRIRVSGKMAMEKPKRFRMVITSITGKEMDLGSNDTHFWFWSKRMDVPVLHYAKHEDLNKSFLKTPLNPGWLMGSLNLGELVTTDAKIIKYKDYYGILMPKTSANGESVTILTLISPQKKAVIGHYLYNTQGKMIASTEVKSFNMIDEHIVPKEMVIIWYAEGVKLEWTLNDPKINVGIDPAIWVMPTMPNAIDMGKIKPAPKK